MEIRFDLSEDELEMVRDCAEMRGVSMEILIREAILDKIEDDINRMEDRLVNARKQLEKDRVYGNVEILNI